MIELSITQRHITAGIKNDPANCPFALAAIEQLGYKEASFGPETTITTQDGKVLPLTVSPEIRQWIKDYDEGKEVKPFNVYVADCKDPNGVPAR